MGFAQFNVFPIDVNKADYQLIMRIPGIGIQSAKKICDARRFGNVTWEHLKKFGIALNRARYFVEANKDFETKDLQPMQIKQFILQESQSKYRPNFSPQTKLF